MTVTEVMLKIYDGLLSRKDESGIPVRLRARSTIGTIQDDPFDCWVEEAVRAVLSPGFDVYHSGALTTPDLVIRERKGSICIGLEIKKLGQTVSGKDSRGLTIDYNSSLPCGSTMIKVEDNTVVIPCYYLFALLSPDNTRILSLILMDGDFINYDFNLYKEAKYANYTEYNHGPYGEGSVRHRKMYTYPNPLNYRITEFYHRFILIGKKTDLKMIEETGHITEQIIRTDIYGNSFYYYLYDGLSRIIPGDRPATLTDIFETCRKRSPKIKTVAIPTIPPIENQPHENQERP